MVFSYPMAALPVPVVDHPTTPPPAAAPSFPSRSAALRRQVHCEAAAFLRAVRVGGLTASEVEAVIAVEPEQRARLLEFADQAGKRTAQMVYRALELRELMLKEFHRLARSKTLARTSPHLVRRRSVAKPGPGSPRRFTLHTRTGMKGQPRAAGAVVGSSSQPKASHFRRALPGAGNLRPAGSPQPGSCKVTGMSRRRELPAVELTCAGPSDSFHSWTRQVGLLALSRTLEVHRTTVHAWLSGKRVPEPKHARMIIALSTVSPLSAGARGRRLTYEDIYGRVEARTVALRGEGCLSGV